MSGVPVVPALGTESHGVVGALADGIRQGAAGGGDIDGLRGRGWLPNW